MKSIITTLLFSLALSLGAQNNAFQAGESLTFAASYNMSGLLTDIAQVTMQTKEVKTKSATLLQLKCKATTYKKWDSFFKVRDLYQSFVNPKTVTPYLYKREIDEGGHYKYEKYNFSHKSKTVKSVTKRKTKNTASGFWEEKKTVNIGSKTKDIVSTIYYLRTLDIHKAPIGASDTFTIIFDNKETKCSFTYVGKETISTALGKKECYKLKIQIVGNNNLLKGKNSNMIWLTADENKIPVFAKFNVAVGSGELKIKSATGLKN